MNLFKLTLISSFLIIFNTYSSYSAEFNSLFGIKLYVDAEKYFGKKFVNSNKSKNQETHKGFYDINVTEKINDKNPFLSSYWVVLDEKNFIKQISSQQEILDLEKCMDFKDQLTKIFTQKYTFYFQKKEFTHKDFYTHVNYSSIDDNKYLSLKCVDTFSSKKINLIISYESKVYRNRKKEFYETGF